MHCNYRMFVIGVLILFMGSSLQARIHSVNSPKEFERFTRRYTYAVVMFYDGLLARKDKVARRDMRDIREAFSRLSRRDFYQYTELQFIQINVASDKGSELASRYGIGTFPTVMLMQRNKPVEVSRGKIARLEGVTSENQIRQFIDDHFDDELEDIAEQKDKDRERRRSSGGMYFSVGYGAYPYYPGYYPYYAYPYGYYGYPYGSYGMGWYW